jgi:hypothetical protein
MRGTNLFALLLLATAIPGEDVAQGAEPSTPARGQYRVPGWVEGLNDEQKAAAPRKVSTPRVRQLPAAAQAPAPLPSLTFPATPIPAVATPVTIAATPAGGSAGRPGQALLRSRTPTDVDSQTRLVSGWGELGERAPLARHAAEFVDEATKDVAPVRNGLGPESSVLQASDQSTTADGAFAADIPVRRNSPTPAPSAADADEAPIPTDDSIPNLSRLDAQGEPTLAVDPASFNGIEPGRTTANEMRAAMEPKYGLGEAFTREDESAGFAWELDEGPFERAEATVIDNVVESIRIKLGDPLSVDELSALWEIGDLNSVSILDESGVSIGEVFPELGLIFSLKPGTRSALAVMIEPLDPEAFVLRAEGELEGDTNLALLDLRYAVQIDPQHLRARRMLMTLLCEQGKWQQAITLGSTTEELDPEDVWTRLKNASVLMSLGRFDEARAKVEAVKAMPQLEAVAAGQVERMLGRIDVESGKPDFKSAVRHFDSAIRTAMPLKPHKSKSVRDAARDVLLDANLGMAVAIAKGEWQKKGEVVSKWLAAATKLVDDVSPDAADRPLLEIQLCRGALAAASGCDSLDPLPWVKRLLVTRDRMSADLTDPWRRRQIDWEVGHGLADALTASQKRGEASKLLDNATLTVAYLERGAEQRELTDAERATIGDLLFRIGVLHSLGNGDHATAVTWFDKVQPYWARNACFTEHGEVGRLGESYVSMAVSYWQVDRRDDALDLCRRGIDCMVTAVNDQLLEEPALALAYGNLSKMYAEQEEEELSKTFAEMASRAEASGNVK